MSNETKQLSEPEAVIVSTDVATPSEVLLVTAPVGSEEMTEAELEQVAGGSFWSSVSHVFTHDIPKVVTTLENHLDPDDPKKYKP